MRNPLISHIVCALSLCVIPLMGQIYPKQGLFDESTGMIISKVGDTFYRGSGVITRDPRLIYSCAHVLYDRGLWASSYRFHRAYHAANGPFQNGGVAPRGYRYFSNYASHDQTYGTTDARTYALDFVIYYADTSFGDAVGYWFDGGEAMRSNQWKRIIGYPSRIEFNGTDGGHYQHGTDWFSDAGIQQSGSYHTFNGVSTGPGNSGGPLFVYDSTDDTSYLAGIVVSGTATTAGVCGLNDDTERMASDALGIEPVTRTFANTSVLRLSDASRTFQRRKIKVADFSGDIETILCNGLVRTKRRGDLAIYLRSPDGGIQWLHKPSNDRRRHLRWRNLDLSATFGGTSANGTWVLHVRDGKKGKRATFREYSLTITAPAEP